MEIPRNIELQLIEQRNIYISPFSGEVVKDHALGVINELLDEVILLEQVNAT